MLPGFCNLRPENKYTFQTSITSVPFKNRENGSDCGHCYFCFFMEVLVKAHSVLPVYLVPGAIDILGRYLSGTRPFCIGPRYSADK